LLSAVICADHRGPSGIGGDGTGVAGRRGPGQRGGHRRRRPRPARDRGVHRGEEDGNRESDYFLFVKGNQPSLQRAAFDAIQEQGPLEPDHTELDRSHGRVIRRSLWGADAGSIDFPHVSRVARIRRDRYDADGSLISKESCTPPATARSRPAPPASRRSPAASGASNRCTGCATPPTPRTRIPDTPE
jgi:hypothetical protein